MRLFQVIVLLASACIMAGAIPPDRGLVEIVPNPPASANDLNALKAQVATLQYQVVELQEAVLQLNLTLAGTREVLAAVGQEASWESAKRMLASKFGLTTAKFAEMLGISRAQFQAAQGKLGRIGALKAQYKSRVTLPR